MGWPSTRPSTGLGVHAVREPLAGLSPGHQEPLHKTVCLGVSSVLGGEEEDELAELNPLLGRDNQRPAVLPGEVCLGMPFSS